MKIKKIKLENIRSYKNHQIEFPLGSTLLSGNIGAGKSTVFLAIDFALFGITRDLPGSALLRNGQKEGSVELNFEVREKEFAIKRTLKRTPNSVSQHTGYIIKNGQKEELTAMELKQNILEILNYPQELLTKSKSTIYHYTVYTPQEKMKEILLSNKENRLEILRKIFGIDKYKKVRNNAELFITTIKQKSKEIAVKISDLEQKQVELSEKEELEKELNDILINIDPKINSLKKLLEEMRIEIETKEIQIREIMKQKHEIEKIKISIAHKSDQIKQLNNNLMQLNKEIEIIQEELKKLPDYNPSLNDITTQIDKEIKSLDEQNLHGQKKLTELETIKNNHENVCNKINSLDHCPLCKQDVEREHKNNVTKNESKKIEKICLELDALKRNITQNKELLENKKLEYKKKIELLNKQNIVELKSKNLKEKIEQKNQNEGKINEIKKEVEELNKILTGKQINENPELEKILEKDKQELEKISIELKEIEITKASKTSEINHTKELLSKLNEEITSKKLAKNNIQKLLQLKEWLEKQFITITSIMEKNLMLRVHTELELFIKKWFSMLIDSESIKIRLDEEFTPLIEQNGHEIDYNHLSGGEKTATALSYRLALNQVINTLMSDINTKNLLMLDEPTDGFSQDQLDRMRNVLEELNTEQTIIVSHDPKVESFVDRVIRLEKSEHITNINTI
jgi:exonuclease SbcC